jgi:hypothetical protein
MNFQITNTVINENEIVVFAYFSDNTTESFKFGNEATFTEIKKKIQDRTEEKIYMKEQSALRQTELLEELNNQNIWQS